jgi:CheY-like chemotaxis protein
VAVTLRVLIVDDELPNLRCFQRAYRKHYDIQVASSGDEALKLMSEGSFDVVLSDYGMPVMTGAQLVEKARPLHRGAFVMVTGYMTHPEVIDLEAAGRVFAVVSKPWERDLLLDVVARACEHTRNQREP